jgi:hypothetical protein
MSAAKARKDVACYLCVYWDRKTTAEPCRKCKGGSAYQQAQGAGGKHGPNSWMKGTKRYTGPGTDAGRRKADGQAQTRKGGTA